MSSDPTTGPFLAEFYDQYLVDQDASHFTCQVSGKYFIGTLQRLVCSGERRVRRAAVLALGFLADYESNDVLGRALVDADRLVRTLAESAIRTVWCRGENQEQHEALNRIIECNDCRHYAEAVELATQLIDQAPAFAEAWNQRAIAWYCQACYAESIADCRQALELNPFHFGAAGGLGQCYVQLDDYKGALASFRWALRLNPNLEGIRASVNFLERSLEK